MENFGNQFRSLGAQHFQSQHWTSKSYGIDYHTTYNLLQKLWSTYSNVSIAEWLENTLIRIPELEGSNLVASNIIIFELFIAYYSKYKIVIAILCPYTISLIAEWKEHAEIILTPRVRIP